MKKIDDKDMIEIFSLRKKYEIKTTSSAILSALNSLENEEKNKYKRIRYIFIPLTSLALCFAMILIIGLNVMNSSNKNRINNISKNKYLTQQIYTFMSFYKGGQYNPLSIMPTKKIDRNTLSLVIDKYEIIQNGVRELFIIEDNSIQLKKSDFVYLDVTYKYQIDYYSSNKTCIGSLYYNELRSDNKDEELILEGLFSYLDSYYYINIESEAKEKKNKFEEEVTTILKNVDDTKDEKVYVIEKEKEYKGYETENSYSLKIYNSYEDKKNDNIYSSVEYEVENEGINVSYLDPIEDFEVENIKQIDENNYSFVFEDDSLDIEEILICLTYNSDLSRTYIADEIIITKK